MTVTLQKIYIQNFCPDIFTRGDIERSMLTVSTTDLKLRQFILEHYVDIVVAKTLSWQRQDIGIVKNRNYLPTSADADYDRNYPFLSAYGLDFSFVINEGVHHNVHRSVEKVSTRYTAYLTEIAKIKTVRGTRGPLD